MAKILDATPEEQKALAQAMEQLQKDAAKLTNAQRKLLSEWGKMSKVTDELKKELDLLKTYEALFAERNAAQKDFNQLLKLQNDMRNVELQLVEREREQKEQEHQAARDDERAKREAHTKLKKELEEQKKLLDKITAEHKAQALLGIDRLGDEREEAQALLKQLQERTKIHKQAEKAAAAAKEEHKAALKTLGVKKKELGDAQLQEELDTKRNKALDNIETSTKSMLKTFTGVADYSDSFMHNILTTEGGFDKMAATMRAKLTGPNVGFSILTKIFESTLAFMKQFDTLAASFRKNTGLIDRGFDGMEQRIVNVQRANLRMGVSMEEAFGAQSALVSGMAQFTSMTDEAQDRILQATVVMQEFGVAASTTAEIFNNFSKGLGYDAKQLEKLSTQIMAIATSLKVPPQIIATDFNAATQELMKYGDDMINVFEGLAEQSKQTGLAMNELLGIAKQFDTFEAAGSAVGKLNAILGGPYLNSINMLYATEEERIKMMRESISLSGRQFKDLSRFEQQAIASAAGINDMSVAAKLFGGTSSEFADTQMSMKEMQERAAKAQAVQEKFTQVMQSFAIALGPVVHVLGDLLEGLVLILNPFTELIDLGNDFGGTANVVVNGVYLIVGSLLLLKKGIIGIQAQTAMMFAGFAAVIAGFLVFKNVIEALEGPLKVFVAILGALAVAAAIASIVATGGLSAVPMVAGLQLLGIGAGLGTVAALPSFDGGKEKGTPVRGSRGIVGEKRREMVLAEDGSTYMVSSPSVVELGTQDTVYTNAQTEMILNGGGNNGAELAQMRASQEDFMQSMREDRRMLERSIKDLASRPLVAELDGKKVWKNQKQYMEKDPNLRIV